MRNINLTIENRIAHIQFAGPDKYNIFTSEIEEELYDVWDQVATHNDIRGVIFSGKECAFLTGTDLHSLNLGDNALMMHRTAKIQNLFNGIQNFKAPTVAAISGYATGAGLELALACDFRFASKTAMLAFPEARIGIIPAIGGTQRLTRLVGIEQAKMMVFTGDMVSAKEAKQMGLVSRVMEPESLLADAKKVVLTMAEQAPLAIAHAKQCIDLGAGMSLEQGLALERNACLSLYMTEDAAEGIDAFLNKRKPVFRGY